MNSIASVFYSSIGRKLVMGLTGLFLISFLLVHASINSFIYVNDGGLSFNTAAHFMASNIIIRILEVVLMLGFLVHIYQSLVLTIANKKSRAIGYAVSKANKNSAWYSRSMGLLGTIILIFLIVHLGNFWVKSRFTGLPGYDANGHPNLYAQMLAVFKNVWIVLLYDLAMISLGYHLLHGFQSAFQTLGFRHKKYLPIIRFIGIAFSIFIPLIFACMPLFIYLQIIK